MQFNSYTFLLFFAVVMGVHHLPLPWWAKKANLLGASYLFYAAWNPPFVLLLWASTLVDWNAAKQIARADSQRVKRAFLGLSLATNLGLLAFFKYGDFALDNAVQLAAMLGLDFQPAALDLVLPVGISFYTFQTLSYTLDVYYGRAKPWHSFLDYALYVTFFPQLVAGPIVRATAFLPQCVEPRRATRAQLGWGLSLLVLGLYEKVVVSDVCWRRSSTRSMPRACRSPRPRRRGTERSPSRAQIFCDFAGYSSCAIGVAMCLGFALPDNFRFPYAAVGFSDFWRRWHVSLSTWLRDYVYIPLGGNRGGQARTLANLMMTMLIGGCGTARRGPSWCGVRCTVRTWRSNARCAPWCRRVRSGVRRPASSCSGSRPSSRFVSRGCSFARRASTKRGP